MRKLVLLCSVALVLSLFLPVDTFGQTKSSGAAGNGADKRVKVAVVQFINEGGGESLDPLCSTGTDILETTLRLLNRYDIQRTDFLLPTYNIQRTKIYFEKERFDNAIFGSITRSEDGEYSFSISVWDSIKDEIIIKKEQTAGSIFDVFDIMDNLTIEVAEVFTGESIGFGTLRLVNTGGEGSYSVYADDQFLGRNIDEQRLLYGRRDVKITVPAGFGEKEIYSEELVIREDEVSEISFALEPQEEVEEAHTGEEPVGRGTLFIDTSPESAVVEFDEEAVGSTPLELFGITGGRYSLNISNPGYLPIERIVNVVPNERSEYSIDLRIDPESPVLGELLVEPGSAGKKAWLSAGVQTGLFISSLYLNSAMNFPYQSGYLLLLSPRLGHFEAGKPITAMVLNMINLAAIAMPMFSGDGDQNFWGTMILQSSTLFGTFIYDAIFAPGAARKENTRRKERIHEIGVNTFSEELQSEKEMRPDTLWAFQLLGGSLVSGGISLPLKDRPFRGELLGGVSFFDPENLDRFALSLTAKGLYFPFHTHPFGFYNGLLMQASYDPALSEDEAEWAAGFGAGLFFGLEFTGFAPVSAVPYIEAQLIYGIRYKILSPRLGIGVRF